MEAEERARVVAVAHTWLRTPYHHLGRVKGSGVDCLTLLAEVFHEAGLVPRIEVGYYPMDWMLHRSEERYLQGLLRYTREVEGPPLPGDVVLWKTGRCYSHGAIVIDWPTIIHAQVGRCVTLDDALATAWLTHVGENTADRGKQRPRKFFSYWGR